jgi:hydrogenase nickel incorporation protein HypA/HybF
LHEMSLMEGIFDIINRYTDDISGKKVIQVTIVVGEMTNALPEALETAFAVFSKNTCVEGAELFIKHIPLEAKCISCEWQGKTEKYAFICPVCSSLELDITSGRELYVESLEVD